MNRAGAGGSRGYIGNNGDNSSSSSSNGGRSSAGGQIVEIGSYSGSGLQGGLGRPIVLGNGEGDEEGDVHNGHLLLNDDEHRLLRLDSATYVFLLFLAHCFLMTVMHCLEFSSSFIVYYSS